MGRFIILFVLMCGVAVASVNGVSLSSFDPRGTGTTVEGRKLVRVVDRVEARFTRLGPIDESYMLFGGDAAQRANRINHATVAGLATHHARFIAERHPDFHMCSSPGASQAKQRVEPMSIGAKDRASVSELQRALKLFEERLQTGGERTCIHVVGEQLSLDRVQLDLGETTEDVTGEFSKGTAVTNFVYATSVETLDCQTLLR
jgi:hypothetical protein